MTKQGEEKRWILATIDKEKDTQGEGQREGDRRNPCGKQTTKTRARQRRRHLNRQIDSQRKRKILSQFDNSMTRTCAL